MTDLIRQTAFIYALTIVISMVVALMIVCLNRIIFRLEDAHKRRNEAKAMASGGKA